MYIEKGESDVEVVAKKVAKSSIKVKKNTNQKSEHNKWQAFQETKKHTEFDKMSYWQNRSNCSYL